ncbi:MAG: oligosaccharide flippase family protein [Nannocystales bacterium]
MGDEPTNPSDASSDDLPDDLPDDAESADDRASSNEAAEPAEPADPGGGSKLQRAAAKGALWVFGAFALGQIVRLGSSLVLSRLLFPEAFGIMRVLMVVVGIVAMLSDAGLRGSIIAHKRGDEPDFYNTAWTLQCLRGLAVAVVVSALAAPLASYYNLPELSFLLPAVGLSLVFRGLQSTAVFTLSRQVNPKPGAVLDLGIRVGSVVIMVALAYVWKSVWVLALGMILSNVASGLATHLLIKGYRNRWRWDKEAVRAQLRFGKWVFLSSALAALLGQGGSAVVAKLLTDNMLGIYSIALLLSEAVTQAMQTVSTKVLQPLYAKFVTGNRNRLRGRMFKVRGALLALALPPLWVLGLFGQEIVDLLFDERYAQAGWMLRILAAGSIGTLIIGTAEMLFVASGDSRSHLIHKAAGATFFVLSMVVGYSLGEFKGVLVGMSIGRILGYLPMAFLLRRRGAWLPKLDALAFAASGGVLALGYWLHPLEIL